MKKRVTWGTLTKVYDVPDTFEGELDAVAKFRVEFADKIPAYRPGKRFSTYMRKFRVTDEKVR